jgi:hypothetical protein
VFRYLLGLKVPVYGSSVVETTHFLGHVLQKKDLANSVWKGLINRCCITPREIIGSYLSLHV